MSKLKRDLTKVSMNLPTHVLDLLDSYAVSHGISRTTAVLILVADGLAANGFNRDNNNKES